MTKLKTLKEIRIEDGCLVIPARLMAKIDWKNYEKKNAKVLAKLRGKK